MQKSISVRHLIGFVKEKALFAFAKIGFFTSNTLQDLASFNWNVQCTSLTVMFISPKILFH